MELLFFWGKKHWNVFFSSFNFGTKCNKYVVGKLHYKVQNSSHLGKTKPGHALQTLQLDMPGADWRQML